MRGITLAGALAAGLCLIHGFGAIASDAKDPAPPQTERRNLMPVIWQSRDGFYAPWSAAQGSRPGAAALLLRPDGSPFDTVHVDWVRGDVSFIPWPLDTLEGRLIGNGSLGQWWRIAPLDRVTGRPSGTLTVPLSALLQTLDPGRMTSLAEKQVGTQVFQGLAELADSVRYLDGEYRVRLRESARFHDGRPVRAGDVVATFRRVLSPGFHAPRVGDLAASIDGAMEFHSGRTPTLRGVREIDSLHVAIAALAPSAWNRLPAAFSEPAAWIVPADVSAQPGFTFEPIGTGPFRVVSSDSGGVLLTAAAGRGGGVDSLRFRLVRSPEDAALQFELGRLDVVSPTERDEARLLASPRSAQDPAAPIELGVREYAAYYIGMNTRAPWLANRVHRRALSAAVDRNLAVRVLVPERSAALYGIFPGQMNVPGLADSLWAPAAQEAVALARMSPPARGLEFWIPEGSATGQRMAEFVQAALGRRGVRVRIVARPWKEFDAGVNGGRADLFYLSWFSENGDPVAFLDALFGSENRGPGGNRTYYANARVDSALAVARTATREAERATALREAALMALSDAPLIPLFQSINVTLVRPWVRGLVLDPYGCPRYDTVEIVRPAARTAEGD